VQTVWGYTKPLFVINTLALAIPIIASAVKRALNITEGKIHRIASHHISAISVCGSRTK